MLSFVGSYLRGTQKPTKFQFLISCFNWKDEPNLYSAWTFNSQFAPESRAESKKEAGSDRFPAIISEGRAA